MKIPITVIYSDGRVTNIQATVGNTLMEEIPGLFGDCGGNCVCSTCHVKILSETPMPMMEEMERLTLDLAQEVEYNSRLSCQIVVAKWMNDLTVRVIE